MTPQDIQAAAMANLMKLQSGGQGPGPLGQQGGYGNMNRVTSRIPPVMPGTRIEEDMPQFDTRTMGNRQAGPPPGGLEAILRRLGSGGGGGPSLPGAVPGEHMGMSELGQGSQLEEIIQLLQNSQRMQSPTSMIPGVPPGIGIEEDMPQWDWKTMGNQRRGVTDALSGKKRIEKSNAPKVGRAR